MEDQVERSPEPATTELARDETSRKRFLKMVGGAGAVGAFSMFLAACGDDEDEETGQTGTGSDTGTETQASAGGDLEIVNYALTLEYLEADFYQQVIDAKLFKGAEAELVKSIGEHEQEHVDALIATAEQLGGTPAEKPQTKFEPVIEGGKMMILETAASVENLGAAAYLGQAGNIESKEILAAALAIHTVEGRHAAVLNRLVGESFVPDGAFAKPATMEEVLEAVKPFIAS